MAIKSAVHPNGYMFTAYQLLVLLMKWTEAAGWLKRLITRLDSNSDEFIQIIKFFQYNTSNDSTRGAQKKNVKYLKNISKTSLSSK